MQNIKVQFKISKEEDKRILFKFSKRDHTMRSGQNLFRLMIRGREKALKTLPKIRPAKRKKIISKYVEKEYQNVNKFKKLKEKVEHGWNNISLAFLQGIEKVFDGHKFPKGKYTAYLTIFRLYPRDIKNKTFQIRPKGGATNANYTITHELMHYMFFDYFNKHFKKHLNEGLKWDFSEIINVIIQNRAPFNKMYKEKAKPYPKHKKRYEVLNKIYGQCPSMHEFFKKAIKIIKTMEE